MTRPTQPDEIKRGSRDTL